MNFVDFVIDCYSHITSHVSQAFASCTHYKLLFAKLGTLYCVWFCCGHPRLKVLWFQCKMCLMFALWGQIDWKYWFWKIWVEFKCFWKTFRLILMHFFIKQCALRSFYIKMLCFSKIWFFQTFDWSNLIFDKSKLRIKISMRFYMFRLIETIFRSIEYRESVFF